jgi:four helix bundle protein
LKGRAEIGGFQPKAERVDAVRDYRDLIAWQRAMDLLVVCHAIAGELGPSERFELGKQLQRAAGSAAANVAEGNGRESRREYIRFLTIAIGSIREVETHLEAGRHLGLIPAQRAADARLVALETAMLVMRLRASLRR